MVRTRGWRLSLWSNQLWWYEMKFSPLSLVMPQSAILPQSQKWL